jgi:predicted hydrocarbon binding protein
LSADGDRRNLEIAALVFGGIVVPIVTSLILPALPKGARVPVGVGIGATLLVGGGVLFLQFLRRVFAHAATTVADTLERYSVDPQTGGLFKGRIRNVSLRTATIHRLLDTIVQNVPEAQRHEVLYRAGEEIGTSWGADLEALCRDMDLDSDDTTGRFELWARYDATAGMGAMDIDVAAKGSGSVTVRNSFLSDMVSSTPLNYWFAGYIAGTLEHLLGQSVIVELVEPSTHRQVITRFAVRPTNQ